MFSDMSVPLLSIIQFQKLIFNYSYMQKRMQPRMTDAHVVQLQHINLLHMEMFSYMHTVDSRLHVTRINAVLFETQSRLNAVHI